MRDSILKIRFLFSDILNLIFFWKKDVWDIDLDELYCCNGDMCGCMAATHREMLMYHHFGRVIRNEK